MKECCFSHFSSYFWPATSLYKGQLHKGGALHKARTSSINSNQENASRSSAEANQIRQFLSWVHCQLNSQGYWSLEGFTINSGVSAQNLIFSLHWGLIASELLDFVLFVQALASPVLTVDRNNFEVLKGREHHSNQGAQKGRLHFFFKFFIRSISSKGTLRRATEAQGFIYLFVWVLF